jgi:hypothetical protein
LSLRHTIIEIMLNFDSNNFSMEITEKEDANILEITLLPNPDAKDESENQGTYSCVEQGQMSMN